MAIPVAFAYVSELPVFENPVFSTLDSNRRYFRMVPWIKTAHPSQDHAPRSDPRETNYLKQTFFPVPTNANYQTESPCTTQYRVVTVLSEYYFDHTTRSGERVDQLVP